MAPRFKCKGFDELQLVANWVHVANRCVTMLAVIVTVGPEGQLPDQLLLAVQLLGLVIEAEFVFEGGEEALHQRILPAAALGRHAADDFVDFQ